mgnify:CR=1 FL=1
MKNSYEKFLQFTRHTGIGFLLIGGVCVFNGSQYGNFLVTLGSMLLSLYYFLSAFQPIKKAIDWTLVYPELSEFHKTDDTSYQNTKNTDEDD